MQYQLKRLQYYINCKTRKIFVLGYIYQLRYDCSIIAKRKTQHIIMRQLISFDFYDNPILCSNRKNTKRKIFETIYINRLTFTQSILRKIMLILIRYIAIYCNLDFNWQHNNNINLIVYFFTKISFHFKHRSIYNR